MHLTNGFTEFKKEFWLLQALNILEPSAPFDMQNIFEGMLLDFLGILRMLKGKLSLLSKRPTWNLIFFSFFFYFYFFFLSRSKKVSLALLPFCMYNSNSSGYISLELLSIIPPSLITCIFLSCHIRVSEWIYTIYLPECQQKALLKTGAKSEI